MSQSPVARPDVSPGALAFLAILFGCGVVAICAGAAGIGYWIAMGLLAGDPA